MLTTPDVASACSPTETAIEQAPTDAATTGYFVKARIVRGFNAEKKLPEMLEIEKIFVGKDIPRFVTLDRDDRFFEVRRNGAGDTCTPTFSSAQPKSALYILYPVPGKPGVFALDWLWSASVHGRGLEVMLAEARRNGRLRGRPLPEDF